MLRFSSASARVLFSPSPARLLFFSVLSGVLFGILSASRLEAAAQLLPLPQTLLGRSLLRTAIVSFLFPLAAYLFALCFGALPTALLFFCKGLLLSCLLYQAAAQGAAARTVLYLLFHSLLPLPLQLCAVSRQLSEDGQKKTSSALPLLLVSSILIFFAELCLSRLGI